MSHFTYTKLGGWADILLELMASLVLFAMMAVTAVDVIGRYLLNSPLPGAFEVTELMLVILIYAGLPLVSRRGEHVVVDVFDRFLSTAARRALDVIAHLLAGAAFAGMALLIFQKARKIVEFGDTTASLKIGLAPFVFFMSALILATAVIHFLLAFAPARQPRVTEPDLSDRAAF
jgi:TRAP-type C4-dicarboxylate transport system permease small subunit